MFDNVTAAERQAEPTLGGCGVLLLAFSCLTLAWSPLRALVLISFPLLLLSLIALYSIPLHRGNING
jgi:hypothetical protein